MKITYRKRIIKELKRKNLAIFAGAGLSMGAGFISWKELIRDIADGNWIGYR